MSRVTKIRRLQDSNLRGETPSDFESDALTTRPNRLILCLGERQHSGQQLFCMDANVVRVCFDRQQVRGLLRKRKLERVAVQHTSKQKLHSILDRETLQDVRHLDEESVERCLLNRSGLRTALRQPKSSLWNRMDQVSEKVARLLITPDVVRSDQNAIDRIKIREAMQTARRDQEFMIRKHIHDSIVGTERSLSRINSMVGAAQDTKHKISGRRVASLPNLTRQLKNLPPPSVDKPPPDQLSTLREEKSLPKIKYLLPVGKRQRGDKVNSRQQSGSLPPTAGWSDTQPLLEDSKASVLTFRERASLLKQMLPAKRLAKEHYRVETEPDATQISRVAHLPNQKGQNVRGFGHPDAAGLLAQKVSLGFLDRLPVWRQYNSLLNKLATSVSTETPEPRIKKSSKDEHKSNPFNVGSDLVKRGASTTEREACFQTLDKFERKHSSSFKLF